MECHAHFSRAESPIFLRKMGLWNDLSVVSLALDSFQGNVTWTATPFNPASVPLAVRTPYLSAWLPQGRGSALNDGWSTFWTGQVFLLHDLLTDSDKL